MRFNWGIAFAAALTCTSPFAQTIYKCGNSYSETACPEGKAVDILPTEGAHSMSGKKRMSTEASYREANRQFDAALEPAIGMKPGTMAAERERIKQEKRAKKNAIPPGNIEWSKQ